MKKIFPKYEIIMTKYEKIETSTVYENIMTLLYCKLII